MRVLLTGFEPFATDSYNASGEAVRLLAEQGLPELAVAILPVTFAGAPQALSAAIEREQPEAVVCVGEAGGRPVITPERWAVNSADARIPDNEGAQPREEALGDGPERLASRLDVDALVAALREAEFPAEASEDAGRFVCNATMWAALRNFDGPTGFVHIPAVRPAGHQARVGVETDSVAGVPTQLTIADLVHALEIVVRVVQS